ncbi:MAG TPA: DUF6680 family protein [Candidatus Limnocylindria bacterium]|nr:DUF6680 family protein [Candidatus Limnocylindria bacterium]
MKVSDWIMVAAVFLGPIVSIQLSEFLQRRRQVRDRKEWIFKTLMATRGQTLAYRHVEALNLITLEFSEKIAKEKDVIAAWKAYLDLLNNFPEVTAANTELFSSRRNDLLTALLQSMAIALDYDFDSVQIRRGCYAPRGHETVENELGWMRRGLLEVIAGQRPIPITIFNPPSSAPGQTPQIQPSEKTS